MCTQQTRVTCKNATTTADLIKVKKRPKKKVLCNSRPINGDEVTKSPRSPDHLVLPPTSWLNGALNTKTKSNAAPVLSSSHYSEPDRHPVLPQTRRINTALVKVDPLKFTLWGLQQGRGSLQALHKEQELHFNCAHRL